MLPKLCPGWTSAIRVIMLLNSLEWLKAIKNFNNKVIERFEGVLKCDDDMEKKITEVIKMFRKRM